MFAEFNTGWVLLGVLMMIGASILRRCSEASEEERLLFKAVEGGGTFLAAGQIATWEYLRANPMIQTMLLYWLLLTTVGLFLITFWELFVSGIEKLLHM